MKDSEKYFDLGDKVTCILLGDLFGLEGVVTVVKTPSNCFYELTVTKGAGIYDPGYQGFTFSGNEFDLIPSTSIEASSLAMQILLTGGLVD